MTSHVFAQATHVVTAPAGFTCVVILQHTYTCHVSLKSIQGFWSYGVSKFGHSHHCGYWLSQLLELPYKLLCTWHYNRMCLWNINCQYLDRLGRVGINSNFRSHNERWDVMIGRLTVDVNLCHCELYPHPVSGWIVKQQSTVWWQTDATHAVDAQLRRRNHRHVYDARQNLLSCNTLPGRHFTNMQCRDGNI